MYVRKIKSVAGTKIIYIYYFQITDTPIKIVICTIMLEQTFIRTINSILFEYWIWIFLDSTEMTVNVLKNENGHFTPISLKQFLRVGN